MQGYCATFAFRHYFRLLFKSADDAVYSVKEVLAAYVCLVVARRDECRLVAYVGDVGAGEARSLPCQHVDVDAFVNLYRLQMHLEDFLALVKVGQVYVYLPVETSCAEQRGVKHVGAVCGGEYDDTAVCAEAVHFC